MQVGVFFGGKSVEHEISIITALGVIKELKNKYKVYPVYLDKDNEFYLLDENIRVNDFGKAKKIVFSKGKINKISLDVAVLCFHGSYGEDGRVSGLLDIYDIPHTGSNTASLSICQDKIFTKQLLKYNKINVIEETEDFPCILKASNLGSSIGIKVVKDSKEFIEAISEVKQYDYRILREEYISNFREVNIGVITDGINYEFSNIEEVFKNKEILSFEDKYLSKSDLKTNRDIPAKIDKLLEQEIKEIAKKACDVLNIRGVIRIDFLIKDKVYVNEINSIPGSLSYYLWDMKYIDLLEKIMKIALIEKSREDKLTKSFKTNILKINEKK